MSLISKILQRNRGDRLRERERHTHIVCLVVSTALLYMLILLSRNLQTFKHTYVKKICEEKGKGLST
jgi:hypothetical protein